MAVQFKTLLSEAFRQITPPTRFLQNIIYKTPDEYVTQAAAIQIDKIRGFEEYAIDIAPGSGGRPNDFNKFTDKEYVPPMFDEYAYLTAETLQKRMPGRTKYDIGSYTRDFADLALEYLVGLRDKVTRAIEIQCRDGLFYGKITLVNGDIIDFKMKATHIYDTPTVWTNSAADPMLDFATLGGRMRSDGGREPVDAIGGRVAVSKFLNNQNVKESAKLEQIERAAITSPIAREEGSKYHGTFSAEDYKINLWTYPQTHRVPEGFNLLNEGTNQPYIPDDRFVLLPADPECRLYYAGVPTLAEIDDAALMSLLGMGEIPTLSAGKVVPYANLDREKLAIKVGVRSRPLAIPVEVDGIGVLVVT